MLTELLIIWCYFRVITQSIWTIRTIISPEKSLVLDSNRFFVECSGKDRMLLIETTLYSAINTLLLLVALGFLLQDSHFTIVFLLQTFIDLVTIFRYRGVANIESIKVWYIVIMFSLSCFGFGLSVALPYLE